MRRRRTLPLAGLAMALADGWIAGATLLFLWSLETEVPPGWSILDPATRRLVAVFVPGLVALVALAGGYRSSLRTSVGYQILTAWEGAVAAGILTLAATAGRGDLAYFTGSFLAAVFGLLVVGLAVARLGFEAARRRLFERGYGRRPVALLGSGPEADELEQALGGGGRLPYRLALSLTAAGPRPADGRLGETAGRLGIEKVLVARGRDLEPLEAAWLAELRAAGVEVAEVLPPRRVRVGETRVHDLLGLPPGIAGRRPQPVNYRLKRALDLGLTVPALLVLAPLGLLAALAIKLDSAGPVFYRQERLTAGGRRFGMFKFRSMVAGADRALLDLRSRSEVDGPIFKIRRDPRITAVGRFLRRFSLDELPQLLNVLAGDLSLVGPRPPIPAEVEQYEPWQRRRLTVVQGLTGLWQVSGRSDLTFEEMVLLDIYYIEHWSLRLDLEILFDTLPTVLLGKGAY